MKQELQKQKAKVQRQQKRIKKKNHILSQVTKMKQVAYKKELKKDDELKKNKDLLRIGICVLKGPGILENRKILKRGPVGDDSGKETLEKSCSLFCFKIISDKSTRVRNYS